MDYEDETKTKNKRVYVDCFTNNKNNRDKLIFPDSLFFQTDTLDFSSLYNDKKKNRVAVKGLFDIFNEYKFTIDENTPIEQEIALDPELLGQTLENLLASYNPETKATARKSTGSYYTPREIVDYMVDESLIAYLSQYLKDNDETLKDMDSLDELLRDTFAYTEKSHPFSEQEVETIIDAVFKLKMLDPACGSGAFPMGILLKMVYVLKRIDPENKIWKKKLIKTIPEEMKPYIEINTDNFSRKLGLIWNSIYGVDIQTIAIQLTKLRFFISLIAEEKVDWNNEDNFGILPLPNLETKFVAANTLIGIERPKTSQSDWLENELKQKENELKHNRLEYFNANSRREKNRIKIKDKKLRLELADELENYGFKHEITNKIAAWEPYNINHAADWFDPEYMFMITGGFDIVIGNPPYIQLQKFSGQQIQKDYEAQKFESFAKTGDIYELFYEKGNMLLKENGILAFITSNKWMRANYGEKLRKYFAENTQPIQLIDFGGYRVFESATVDTNILIFKNPPLQRGGSEAENSKNSPLAEGWHEVTGCSACTIRKGFTRETDIAKYLKQNGIELSNISEESWIISTKEEFAIKQKIEKIGTPLKDWDISINYGIKTGFNEAFIISGEKKDELIAKDPKSAEIIKPILRGRDIKRYKAEFADLWLIATHNGYHKFPSFRGVARSDGVFKNNKKENIPRINIEDYPAIKEHLDKYWDKISVRYDKGDTPYNLRNCAYYEEFEKEKIVYPDIAEKLTFVLDSNNFFINNTCYFINTIKSNKYVLSVLSSNLMNWYFRNVSSQLGKKGLRHFNIYIEKIPLPKITPENQKPFEILVDQILQRKETPRQTSSATPLQEGNTTHLENQIDLMVYKLYELTYEEIKIVDEDFDTVLAELGLDKEDFENKSLQDLAEFFGVNEKVTESEIEENTKIVAVEEQSAEPIIEVPEPKEIIQEKIEPTKKVQYQFEVGQSVKHKTFGVGIIKNVKGSGENTTVIVKFGKESKKLMARYAKLEIV
ncbi:MAG: Eco57I restriction-modification methylase domain-containing protein [Candidatus Cloacimonetes bacterium]|nr:Eco57I restriction-modification methylase domain-containing protein [Candidatus Cloacimonadota bacterium]